MSQASRRSSTAAEQIDAPAAVHSAARRKEVDAAARPPAGHDAHPLAGPHRAGRPGDLDGRPAVGHHGKETGGAGETPLGDGPGQGAGCWWHQPQRLGSTTMSAGPGGAGRLGQLPLHAFHATRTPRSPGPRTTTPMLLDRPTNSATNSLAGAAYRSSGVPDLLQPSSPKHGDPVARDRRPRPARGSPAPW